MKKFGYIINKSYTPHPRDITWNFVRLNKDGSYSEYKGIETFRKIQTNSDIIFFKSKSEMDSWINEHVQSVFK